jgi:hypothetical protein
MQAQRLRVRNTTTLPELLFELDALDELLLSCHSARRPPCWWACSGVHALPAPRVGANVGGGEPTPLSPPPPPAPFVVLLGYIRDFWVTSPPPHSREENEILHWKPGSPGPSSCTGLSRIARRLRFALSGLRGQERHWPPSSPQPRHFCVLGPYSIRWLRPPVCLPSLVRACCCLAFPWASRATAAAAAAAAAAACSPGSCGAPQAASCADASRADASACSHACSYGGKNTRPAGEAKTQKHKAPKHSTEAR